MPSSDRRPFTEQECWTQLARLRWPGGVVCATCQRLMSFRPKRRLFQCPRCAKHASVTAGTIFHHSRLPLTQWFEAIYWMAHAPQGISMKALQKKLGLRSYRSAWLLAHKIRQVMLTQEPVRLLSAIPKDVRFIKRPHPDLVGGTGVPVTVTRNERSGVLVPQQIGLWFFGKFAPGSHSLQDG